MRVWEWFTDAIDRWGQGWVPTEDEAIELGFMPMDVLRANRILEAAVAPADLLIVAMDLSRFVNESLEEAAFVLALAYGGYPQKLQRWGLDPKSVRTEVAGMAKAHAATINGQAEVRAARRALSG